MPIPRYYFSKGHIKSIRIHGFSDASKHAYVGVVYIRGVDIQGSIHVALDTSKTKVAPIKQLTIPRLEICGAQLLAQLLGHVREVLQVSIKDTFGWTDSTIVLNWLKGSPKTFKTYVCNRVSYIVETIPNTNWFHVNGADNPADCASRGMFPSELLDHGLWWKGPAWLRNIGLIRRTYHQIRMRRNALKYVFTPHYSLSLLSYLLIVNPISITRKGLQRGFSDTLEIHFPAEGRRDSPQTYQLTSCQWLRLTGCHSVSMRCLVKR